MAMNHEEWATASLKEAPYWRDGMSVEEYERERDYFNQNWDAFVRGEYRPLWMQK